MSAAAAPTRRRVPVTAPRTRVDVWRLAPLTAAAIGAAIYLAIHPHTVDLAAHLYRTNLFDREGFTINVDIQVAVQYAGIQPHI